MVCTRRIERSEMRSVITEHEENVRQKTLDRFVAINGRGRADTDCHQDFRRGYGFRCHLTGGLQRSLHIAANTWQSCGSISESAWPKVVSTIVPVLRGCILYLYGYSEFSVRNYSLHRCGYAATKIATGSSHNEGREKPSAAEP